MEELVATFPQAGVPCSPGQMSVYDFTGTVPPHFKGLKRWDEGRWGIGNKPQYSRVYIKDPLTHRAF